MFFHRSGRAASTALLLIFLAAAAGFAQVPASNHVVLVIDENSSYSAVMANMPWLIGQGDTYGYASNYHSNNGGSLLNYLWLASGSCESSANCVLPSGAHNFYCTGDSCYYPGTSTTDPITDDNIFREMNKAGVSWKVYAQSYAAAGGKPTTPDHGNGTAYYRRHNAATWYSDILSNVNGSASKIVDLSQLNTDISNGTLPRFMIIVPDGHHDAHDCPVGMSSCTQAQKLAAADKFLSSTLIPILNTTDFQPGGTGLILVTFDECGNGTDAGCGASVYTTLMGPRVVPHKVSTVSYKHENALRTILDSLGIRTYPGYSAGAKDMSDFFTNTKPQVTVSSPASGALVPSAVTIKASASPSSGEAITGWWVYVDSVAKYNAGSVTSISPSISMSTGTHTVVVRAWDTSQAYGDQTFKVNVSSKPVVAVSSPSVGASVSSPISVKASATPTSGHTISGWWVYLDGVAKYNGPASGSISTSIAASTGSHTIIIRAWDSSGAYGDQTVTVKVQ